MNVHNVHRVLHPSVLVTHCLQTKLALASLLRVLLTRRMDHEISDPVAVIDRRVGHKSVRCAKHDVAVAARLHVLEVNVARAQEFRLVENVLQQEETRVRVGQRLVRFETRSTEVQADGLLALKYSRRVWILVDARVDGAEGACLHGLLACAAVVHWAQVLHNFTDPCKGT